MNDANGTNWNYQGLSGTNTCGYMQQCGEREKFCPRDGKAFEPGDSYCSKCGRAVGYISGYNPYYQPPYTITWGQQQQSTTAQQQLEAYSQAAAAARAQQYTEQQLQSNDQVQKNLVFDYDDLTGGA